MNYRIKPFSGMYIIQEHMSYGWDATWYTTEYTREPVPLKFRYKDDAQTEITEVIDHIEEAIKDGYMDENSRRTLDDFRIVMADMDKDGNVVVYEIDNPQNVYQTFNIRDQY